jgi:predicted nucleotide-binding protein
MARKPATPPAPQSANLTVDQMMRGIDRLNRRIADLEAFDPATVQERWAPEVGVLGKAIEETLSAVFGHGTIEYMRYLRAEDLDDGPVVLGGAPASPYEVQKYLSDGKQKSLLLLRQAIRGLEEEIVDQQQHTAAALRPRETAPSRDLSKVFIVHGHDGEARQAVARFIEKLGFEAVILHERPNKGRTIITKFREEAAGVGFAVVLMTPDDVGGLPGLVLGSIRPRARQNVVFELGFFIGALGSERVAAMVKGDIERPSDFDGVVYVSLDSGNWKADLARELEAAGYVIDWNKAMRA